MGPAAKSAAAECFPVVLYLQSSPRRVPRAALGCRPDGAGLRML